MKRRARVQWSEQVATESGARERQANAQVQEFDRSRGSFSPECRAPVLIYGVVSRAAE